MSTRFGLSGALRYAVIMSVPGRVTMISWPSSRLPARSEGWGGIWWLLAYRQTSIGMPRANGRLRRAPLAFRGISRALTCYDGNAINTNTKLTLVVLIVFFLALALAALWML